MAVSVIVGMSQTAELGAAALAYLDPTEFFVRWSAGETMTNMASPTAGLWTSPLYRGPNAPLSNPTVAYVAVDPAGTANFTADAKAMFDILVDTYTGITDVHFWILVGADDHDPGTSGENGFTSCSRHETFQDDLEAFVAANPTYLTQGSTQVTINIHEGPEILVAQPADFEDELGHLTATGKHKAGNQLLTYLGFSGSLAAPPVRSVSTFVAVATGDLTPTAPAGVAVGDWVGIFVVCRGVEAPAAPTNWTLQGTPSTTGVDLAVYSRDGGWQGGDSMPTFSGLGGAAGAAAVAVQDVNLAFPYHIAERTQTASVLYSDHAPASTVVPTAVDTANPNALVITAVATSDNNALAFQAGGAQGFTDQASGTAYEKSDGPASTHHSFMLATKTQTTQADAVTQPTFEQTVNGSDAWESARLVLQGVPTLTPTGFTGTLAVTQADQTSTATGTVEPPPITGTSSAVQADQASDATGTFTAPAFTGTSTAVQDDQTSAASGSAAAPAFTGTTATTQDGQALAASGSVVSPDTTVWLAPTAQGTGDGSSAANADVYTNINSHIAPGAVIELITSAGAYHKITSSSITITAGGSVGNRCVIRGPNDGDRAQLTSNRLDPWVSGTDGQDFFQLGVGASFLEFAFMDFHDAKTCFQIGADTTDLAFHHIDADNVRFLYENRIVAGQTTASISGLAISDSHATRYSKRMIDLDYDTHDVTVTDVTGDSAGINGDPIAMGCHMGGTVHDVIFERVVFRNHWHDNGALYWNGDGWSSEEDTYRLTFIDCEAYGGTDSGWDLKSDGVRMLRCVAADNKRNFRFWGADVLMVNCVGAHPLQRAGTGTQAQVHGTDLANVTLEGCVFVDWATNTIVFDADQFSSIDAGDSTVTRHTSSTLKTTETNATCDTTGITDNTRSALLPTARAWYSARNYLQSGDWLDLDNAHHLAATGNPVFTYDGIGSRWAYDGDDRHSTLDDPNLDFGAAESFTVVAKIRFSAAPSANAVVVGKKGNFSNLAGWAMYVTSARQLRAILADGSTNHVNIGPTLNLDTWYVVVARRDVGADTLRVWANNVGSTASTDTTTATLENALNMAVASLPGGANFFTGEISQAAVWRSALTTTSIETELTDEVNLVYPAAPSGGTLPGFGSSGIANPVQDDQTSTASGTFTPPVITGTLTAAQESQVSTASGTHNAPGVDGTLTVIQDAQTLTASGAVVPPGFAGTSAATQDAQTSTASGLVGEPSFTGTLGVTQQDQFSTASGTVVNAGISGSFAATQENQVVTAAGTFTPPAVTGTASLTQDDQTSTASGTFTAPGFTGTSAVVQADQISAASGTVTTAGIVGSLAVTQDAQMSTAGGVNVPAYIGTMAVTQDDQVLAAIADVGGLTFWMTNPVGYTPDPVAYEPVPAGEPPPW